MPPETPPDPKSSPDEPNSSPDEVLAEYERPEMPWEREGSAGPGGTALASEFTVIVGIFLGLGWWLDGRWGTKPWLLVAGTAVGLTLGIYRLATAGARAMAREERKRR